MKQPLIKSDTIKVLWSCKHCGESHLMYRPVRSRKQCPNCHKSMTIERTIEDGN